jgi:DNA-binding response OmpR family regulator
VSRIIIIEDDAELRDSLADFLTACGESVTGVGSAVELYQLLATEAYDVALVDVNLPHHDGLSVTRYLSEHTDMAVIVMTVMGSVDDRVRGYNSGADLYMVKPVDCDELAAAVASLVRRRARLAKARSAAPAAAGWRLERLHVCLVAPTGRSVTLTRRELQLVEALAARPGTIVSRADLAGLLGYDAADPDSRALDAAISRLRVKVQTEAATTLPLQTVQGAGYVFSGQMQIG